MSSSMKRRGLHALHDVHDVTAPTSTIDDWLRARKISSCIRRVPRPVVTSTSHSSTLPPSQALHRANTRRRRGPGSSGRRSRGRPSRSSPRRSARDPMTGGSDTHRHNRDPRRRPPVQSPGARPNTLRRSRRLGGPGQMPRSRRPAPRSAPACSCVFCRPR